MKCGPQDGETLKLTSSGFSGPWDVLGQGLRVCSGCKAPGSKEDLAPMTELGIHVGLFKTDRWCQLEA